MDRRTVWAILLMMAIAIVPAVFLKRPTPSPPAAGAPADTVAPVAVSADSGAEHPGAVETAPIPDEAVAGAGGAADTTMTPRIDTIWVTSPLYRYGFSTLGGRMVAAVLSHYPSMAPGAEKAPVQLLPDSSDLLALALVVGKDTLSLADWSFTPSANDVSVNSPAALELTARRGDLEVRLTYGFQPGEYQVAVAGSVTGVGPNGGVLLVGMGPTLANTEYDPKDLPRSLALVTKRDETERTNFTSLTRGESKVFDGPFEWTAIKSKYFVTALLAFDSAGGGISGVTARAPAVGAEKPTEANIRLSLPLPASGAFGYRLYAGPMEYDRLSRLGHDFDDVNPYGWPGFRTVIRVIATPVRWLLVWMHDHLSLAYGIVLIIFGLLVRVVLWPLNQKAMRASMAMQAIQPQVKALQEQYKSDPQRMQQEMFKLYREHNVNPLGGCWPMLLPMPVFIALFFVFQNAIELRGVPFLWLPDLARPDPLYIIPVLMGLSSFVVAKIGQRGVEPNPQSRMMVYMMPGMMTVMFLFFPSGLNLYYAVSNIASIPQQWMLANERQRRSVRAIVNAKTAPAEPSPSGRHKSKPKKG